MIRNIVPSTGKFLLFIPVFLWSIHTGYAQIGGDATFSFLNLVSDARTAAMGGDILIAKDNDLNLAVDNPSLITPKLHQHLSLSFVDYYDDIHYGFVSYGRHLEKLGSFTGTLRYVDYGKFTYADETGQTYGDFRAGDYAFQVGWGRPLDSLFSLGANLKFIYSELEHYTASGLAADVSGTYHNSKNDLTISLLARNIGRQLNTYVPSQSEPLPFEILLGLSKKLKHVPLRYAVLLTNLQQFDLTYDDPNEPDTDPLTGEPITENKVEDIADKLMRHIVLGAELSPSKNFSLRFGYNYKVRQEMKVSTRYATAGFSWGFGFRVSKFHFNYARKTYHLAGSPNYISITTNLSDFIGGGS